MENSLATANNDLVKQKQSLEIESLQISKEKQLLIEVEMLKKSNDSVEFDKLLKIVNAPGVSRRCLKSEKGW